MPVAVVASPVLQGTKVKCPGQLGETPNVSRADIDRYLAVYMGQKFEVSRKRMDRLSNIYSATVVALLIEIAAFVIDLWSR